MATMLRSRAKKTTGTGKMVKKRIARSKPTIAKPMTASTTNKRELMK